MSVAANPLDSQPNIFQTYLIPAESRYVRLLMKKASHFSKSENFIYSHLCSVACAVTAMALSAINAVSNLLQIPFKILLNVARFDPVAIMTDFIGNLINVMKSVYFVFIGITLFMIVGILLPREIFQSFNPELTLEEKKKNLEEKRQKEFAELKMQIAQLERNIQEGKQQLENDDLEESQIAVRTMDAFRERVTKMEREKEELLAKTAEVIAQKEKAIREKEALASRNWWQRISG